MFVIVWTMDIILKVENLISSSYSKCDQKRFLLPIKDFLFQYEYVPLDESSAEESEQPKVRDQNGILGIERLTRKEKGVESITW